MGSIFWCCIITSLLGISGVQYVYFTLWLRLRKASSRDQTGGKLIKRMWILWPLRRTPKKGQQQCFSILNGFFCVRTNPSSRTRFTWVLERVHQYFDSLGVCVCVRVCVLVCVGQRHAAASRFSGAEHIAVLRCLALTKLTTLVETGSTRVWSDINYCVWIYLTMCCYFTEN